MKEDKEEGIKSVTGIGKLIGSWRGKFTFLNCIYCESRDIPASRSASRALTVN